ncbi:MAG: glycosyltransferase family 2 protein [Caldilineaceae bacterium]
MVIFLLQLILWVVGSILALMVGYLLLLTIVAWRRVPITSLPVTGPTHRFAIFVPAHNEEKLLPTLLASINQLEYPRHLFATYVVADNCTDQTAAFARAAGAIVYERCDTTNIGKGYALQWLLARLQGANITFEAAVIVDADSIVSTNFLKVMDAHLANGEQVIQAHYAVLHPERSWVMHLRAAALALVHYLRPLSRTTLGGSVGLKGNGMVFRREILDEHRWSASVTEDIEYHMALVLAGKRVAFAPDATVWAEMPGTLRGAYSQNVRWEQGRLQLALQYVPQLLQAIFTKQPQPSGRSTYLLFDSIMEHIIPPFSLLAGGTMLYLLLTAVAGSPALRLLAILLCIGQLLYILGGLGLARIPAGAYLALLYAPFFILWKLWLLLRMVGKGEPQGWIRTARDGA